MGAKKEARLIPQVVHHSGFTAKVNRYVKLKALIAKLEKQRDAIADEFEANGMGIYEGTVNDVNTFKSSRSFLDVAALVADKKLSMNMVKKYTKDGKEFTVCKVQGKPNG